MIRYTQEQKYTGTDVHKNRRIQEHAYTITGVYKNRRVHNNRRSQ